MELGNLIHSAKETLGRPVTDARNARAPSAALATEQPKQEAATVEVPKAQPLQPGVPARTTGARKLKVTTGVLKVVTTGVLRVTTGVQQLKLRDLKNPKHLKLRDLKDPNHHKERNGLNRD